MKQYPLAIYCDHREPHFELGTAAILAGVSEEFIRRCESEALVTFRVMLHGEKGLCLADVCKLKVARHLHEDMGLDLEAVDLVLQYRKQIRAMQRRLADMEQRLRRKEQEHRVEILALRRRLALIRDESDDHL